MSTVTIAERCWATRDDARYERTIQSAAPVKVSVRVNSYQIQSWGRVERWSGDRWEIVVQRAGEVLACYESANRARVLREPLAPSHFAPDVESMLAEAAVVLGEPLS